MFSITDGCRATGGGAIVVLNQVTLRYVCLLPQVAFKFVDLRYVTVSTVCTMISFGPTPRTWSDLSGELNIMKRYVCDFMLVVLGLPEIP